MQSLSALLPLAALFLAHARAEPRLQTSQAPAEPRLENAFPGHARYKRPLWFGPLPEKSPSGQLGRHLVAEQHGLVHVFELDLHGKAGPPARFLDISKQVSRVGNEEGLLGLACHPRFAENGRFYVHYSVRGDMRGRLSEFRAPPGVPGAVDPASERVLLEIEQPYRNHNGGDIVFGPDGFLYWGLGDGGAAGDPEQNGQSLRTLLGKILRLDVDRADKGRAYAIPADNPFVATPKARGEIWALGLRNPWRFSFDPATKKLWCGDVGQDAREEVDVIEKGGNYGWRLREGEREFDAAARRGPGQLAEPLVSYPRSQGWSVTGGFVYRGRRVPSLSGQYVYADYVSGRVWCVPAEAAEKRDLALPRQVATCDSPASFGVDAAGELYLCSFDGRVYRFVE